ncbi:hypothetical protein J2129_001611 [Methanofollis sp. W23]|nr:hypothetical protein [Methanofollis sp. W23]
MIIPGGRRRKETSYLRFPGGGLDWSSGGEGWGREYGMKIRRLSGRYDFENLLSIWYGPSLIICLPVPSRRGGDLRGHQGYRVQDEGLCRNPHLPGALPLNPRGEDRGGKVSWTTVTRVPPSSTSCVAGAARSPPERLIKRISTGPGEEKMHSIFSAQKNRESCSGEISLMVLGGGRG